MERIVTRTVKTYVAKTLVANTETGKTEEQFYPIPVDIPEKKRTEYLKDHNETDTIKIACILDVVKTEMLVCMTEDFFVKNGTAVNDISEFRALLKAKKEKERG